MKKRLCSLLLVLTMLSTLLVAPASALEADGSTSAGNETYVYLGVKDYGTVEADSKPDFVHRFYTNGEEVQYTIASSDNKYAVQNKLQEGYVYDLTIEGGVVTDAAAATADAEGTIASIDDSTVTVNGAAVKYSAIYEISNNAAGATAVAAVTDLTALVGKTAKVYGDTVYLTFIAEPYTAPVSGTPGERTLKNYLQTAMNPVGTALYVYGGSWDWQDVNSSNQALTIGLPQSWIDFFQQQDANYTYKNSADPAHSYYPHNSWNQYYYAGVDCSAYIGWTVYNVMHTESTTNDLSDGYVMSAVKMAKTFADKGWGTWTRDIKSFKPGDIFSMSGHVWTVLGVCDDGSIVFLHSTPSDSKAGQGGGGVQLSALNPNSDDDKNCEAYKLVTKYMTKYYPEWSERYDAVLRSYDSYAAPATGSPFKETWSGNFSWNLDGTGLTDPDGYADMSAAEILADLFGDAETQPSTPVIPSQPSTPVRPSQPSQPEQPSQKGFNDVKPGGVFMINCQWDFDELNHHLKADAKRYIAKNNIQLYTINAIDLAIKIGMGKRNNTILQSAFFSLAKVMPEEQAIQYMKDAATHSYLKKGQDVVDMNHKAIDLGATAYTKIDVPADWANAVDADEAVSYEGKPELVEQVKNILDPVDKMDGDSLPVSAFMPHVDGQWELGAAAYEKRGVAVSVPTWDETKCIQCNNCAYVCPHATIRPFALTEEEAKNAPANAKIVDIKAGKGKGVYKYTMAISPLDCMGCGVCVGQCPVGALTMVGQESELPEQDVFNYCVSKVSDKKDMQDLTVKGSQFKQPMLEFSGSCAGCAETSYARLVTQLFGDRMYISNATGCSSIWGGPGATSPYCTDKNGHGPAWCNSLFEDNAEHGFGMYVGQEKIREDLMAKTEQLLAIEWAQPALKEAAQKWLDTKDDGNANAEATKEYVAALQANIATVDELAAVPKFAEHAAELKAKGEKFCDCDACKLVAEILDKKDYLSKKSVWIFGGDGWAYDIGFGGVDHVLAQNKNVNVFVFDTEVYSNTGGQSSKATPVGAVAQFQASGKKTKKKDLGMLMMTYDNVYVAQCSMGANPNQLIKAIKEAEAHKGPSIVICYAPCINHGIKKGMNNVQQEMKDAVNSGYWNLYRYSPETKTFTLDSKEPTMPLYDFMKGEVRYASLELSFPENAKVLFAEAEEAAKEKYESYKRRAEK